MAHIFLCDDVKKLLKNKFIVVIGSSVQRAMYKDLVLLLQKNKYLTDRQLRTKGELHFEGDELIAGGVKAAMTNGVNFREVREYKTDHHWIKFYFITRCYSTYVDTVLKELSQAPQPDVVVINSCLWDVTRYGYGVQSVVELKDNIAKLCTTLKEVLPEDCLVLWNSTMPVSKEAKGGVIVPEADFLKSTISVELLEANFLTCMEVAKFGFDVIDIHFHLLNQIHRRAEDGVHWDMTAHRRISNLILTHVSEAWAVPFPCNVKKLFDQSKLAFSGKNTSVAKNTTAGTSTKMQDVSKISTAQNQTSAAAAGSGNNRKRKNNNNNNKTNQNSLGRSGNVFQNILQDMRTNANFRSAAGGNNNVSNQVGSSVMQRPKVLFANSNQSREHVNQYAYNEYQTSDCGVKFGGEPVRNSLYMSFEDDWQPYQERDVVHYNPVQRNRPRFTPYNPFY